MVVVFEATGAFIVVDLLGLDGVVGVDARDGGITDGSLFHSSRSTSATTALASWALQLKVG